MKKFWVIFFNIFLILVLFFVSDFAIFSFYKKQYKLPVSYFDNMTKKIAVSDALDKESLLLINSRVALNEQNIDYPSILFIGCSFIYGYGLEEYQTISYKTSKLLKNPVYNLGLPSKAINTTIATIRNGMFDLKVKVPPKTVLYNYADFHLKRLVMPNVFFEGNEFLYRLNNGNLERKRPPFVISRFPLLCVLREQLYRYLVTNNKHYKDYLKKLLKAHFIEMRKLLNEKYGDFKFIILVYKKSPIFEEIAFDMEKEGFIILRVFEDFGIDPNLRIFRLPDGHPSERAWDEIVPKLVPYL